MSSLSRPPCAAPRPLVSIVTPTLNQVRTLEETLRSVAAQSYPALEHVVIDGGSTDGTQAVLATHPAVRWVSEPDRGQADAINKGLRLARGEVVAYLNSDDLLLPGAVETAVAALEAHPEVDFLYGDGVVIDQDGARLWDWLSRPEDWRLLGEYFFLWNDFTNYIMQPATFWRAALHRRVGAFDPSFHYAMDVEFWLRVGASGARMLHVPHPLAAFRVAPGTKTLSSPTAFWPDHLELFRRLHGPRRMTRYVEQYLSEEMRLSGASLPGARARYAEVCRRRWAERPDRAALERLGERAAPGALIRLADHAWNTGDVRGARARLGEARRASLRALLHPRALVLLAKLATGPLHRPARRAWLAAIAAYRDRRYQWRYRARPTPPAAAPAPAAPSTPAATPEAARPAARS